MTLTQAAAEVGWLLNAHRRLLQELRMLGKSREFSWEQTGSELGSTAARPAILGSEGHSKSPSAQQEQTGLGTRRGDTFRLSCLTGVWLSCSKVQLCMSAAGTARDRHNPALAPGNGSSGCARPVPPQGLLLTYLRHAHARGTPAARVARSGGRAFFCAL